VALALPVVAAVVLGLVLGGRLGALAEIELRSTWLFFAAIGLQLVAFPVEAAPWRTSETLARVLWVMSYGLLVVAAGLNRRVTGVPIVAVGMTLNLVAILANRGTMPVRFAAMHDAGRADAVQANSTAMSDPSMPWLVDRWAAPDWIPLANVFSVGDVIIAVGAVVIVLAGMGVRIPRMPARSDARLAVRVASEPLADAREHLQRDGRHRLDDRAEPTVGDHEDIDG
jgi:hypothetical protein